MTDDRDVDLSGVYGGREPPDGLEERVVGAWRQSLGGRAGRSAGQAATRRPTWMRWAAAVVLFVGGVGVGRLVPATSAPTVGVGTAPAVPAATASGRSFMFLLFERPGFGSDQPEGSFAEEYAGWARALAGSGVTVRGNELGLERVVLPPEGGVPETFREIQLGGYFVVEAADLEEATRIAGTHPHMGHGGWVEVAEVR